MILDPGEEVDIKLCFESAPAPLLWQVKEHYCDVPVFVMANGVQEDPARFKDSLRVYYLYNYINEALKGETHTFHCGDGEITL